jgi:3-isopropylmalate/(R)-2-methylmalate dehydratase small subunit
LEVDLVSGAIRNTQTDSSMTAQGVPEFILEILKSGGLIPYLRKKLGIAGQEV